MLLAVNSIFVKKKKEFNRISETFKKLLTLYNEMVMDKKTSLILVPWNKCLAKAI